MTGYTQINISEISGMMGEEYLHSIVSDFSCPLNADVEMFLSRNAIEFSKQGLAATHMVFASYKKKPVLVGYFSLANKHFHIDLKKHKMSNSLRKRVVKFGQYDADLKKHIISAPLIGQLGKNYFNDYNKLITGDELLKLACDKVKEIQQNIGGKIVYLECEDAPKLVEFYQRNGFYNFGSRALECDETELMHGEYLIQLLKYIH